MSNCIKDLYNNELVKQCCRCKNVLLKYNFKKKNRNRTDYIHNANSV